MPVCIGVGVVTLDADEGALPVVGFPVVSNRDWELCEDNDRLPVGVAALPESVLAALGAGDGMTGVTVVPFTAATQ